MVFRSPHCALWEKHSISLETVFTIDIYSPLFNTLSCPGWRIRFTVPKILVHRCPVLFYNPFSYGAIVDFSLTLSRDSIFETLPDISKQRYNHLEYRLHSCTYFLHWILPIFPYLPDGFWTATVCFKPVQFGPWVYNDPSGFQRWTIVVFSPLDEFCLISVIWNISGIHLWWDSFY